MEEQATLRAIVIEGLGGEPEGEQEVADGTHLRVTMWRGNRVGSYIYKPPIVIPPEPKNDPPAAAATVPAEPTVHTAAPRLDYRGMPPWVQGTCGHWVSYAIDLRNGICAACERRRNARERDEDSHW